MIGYFIDGPRRRGTMGLPKGPVRRWQVYDAPEMRIDPGKADEDALPETTIEVVTYRRFEIIGDRAYYTIEPTDEAAWANLAGLICEDIARPLWQRLQD